MIMSVRTMHLVVLSVLLIAGLGTYVVYPEPFVMIVLIALVGTYVTALNVSKAIDEWCVPGHEDE